MHAECLLEKMHGAYKLRLRRWCVAFGIYCRRAVLGRENARLEVDGGDVAEGEDDDGHPVEEDCVRDGVVRIRVTHALGDGVLVAERVAGRDTCTAHLGALG